MNCERAFSEYYTEVLSDFPIPKSLKFLRYQINTLIKKMKETLGKR